MNSKVWRVKNRDQIFSDRELIELIIKKVFNGDDEIKCNEMKDYIAIKDSIYQFYLEGKNENI